MQDHSEEAVMVQDERESSGRGDAGVNDDKAILIMEDYRRGGQHRWQSLLLNVNRKVTSAVMGPCRQHKEHTVHLSLSFSKTNK